MFFKLLLPHFYLKIKIKKKICSYYWNSKFETQTITFVPYSHSLVTMSYLMNWLPYGLWSKDTKNILQGLPIYFYFSSSNFEQCHMASTLKYIKKHLFLCNFFYKFPLFGTLLSQFLPFLNIFCADKMCQVLRSPCHLRHLLSVWCHFYLIVSYNCCSLFFALRVWLALLLLISFSTANLYRGCLMHGVRTFCCFVLYTHTHTES